MNKKRWFALGLAILVFSIQFLIPEISPISEEDQSKYLNGILSNSIPGFKDGIYEEVVEEGDAGNRIAILNLDGAISSVETNPALSGQLGYSHSFMMKQLDKILNDDTITGILFKVNTPGGGVYESAMIRDKILEIKEKRDVKLYVSMGQMAASGGYYVSAPADKIFATEETITGSIGVIMQNYNLEGLFNKYGIKKEVIKSGAMKDIMSSSRQMTDEERKVLQDWIDESFDRFVNVVMEGRNMDEATVRKIADGRIYSGRQALENGLIDEIAWPEEVLGKLKEENGLEKAQVIKYNRPEANPFMPFFSMINDGIKLNQGSDLFVIKELMSKANKPQMPMYMYGGE